VVARRQHVSALPHERDDAEDGTPDVQRVGARRLPEGVLAERADLAALAAAARADVSDDGVSHDRASARATLGDSLNHVVASRLSFVVGHWSFVTTNDKRPATND